MIASKRAAAVSICLVFAAMVFLGVAAFQNRTLLRLRGGQRLDDPVGHFENAPPLMAFTAVVLGGFRGLIADILWLRAARLQEEDRYFELVQLADWITKLEPRITEVWAYHAWNLAYNISALMTEPADRWRWVSRGIELLRNKGMRYNAGDARLYVELGWLFHHKIGGMTDEAHAYYKRRWIEEMTALLGGGYPDYAALLNNPEKLGHMRSEYGLDPAVMKEIDDRYGPLDWRLPQSQAVYWAYRGRRVARQASELLMCHRLIYQSLADLFRFGRLEQRPEQNDYVFGPNLRFLSHVLSAYEMALSETRDETVVISYGNFLRQAVYITHELGQKDISHRLFDMLCRRFPAEDTARGYENFVASRREMERCQR